MISEVWVGTQNPFFSVSQSLFNLYKIFWQVISHLLSVSVHKDNNWILVSVILPALVTEISRRSTGSDSELHEGAMESLTAMWDNIQTKCQRKLGCQS